MQRNDIYDRQFSENVLIASETKCGKTYSMQKLAINNFLGVIVKAELVSSSELTPTREAEINQALIAMLNFIILKHLNVSTFNRRFQVKNNRKYRFHKRKLIWLGQKNSTFCCHGRRFWFNQPIKYIR